MSIVMALVGKTPIGTYEKPYYKERWTFLAVCGEGLVILTAHDQGINRNS